MLRGLCRAPRQDMPWGLTGGFACLPCSLLIGAEAWSTRGRFSSPLGGKTRSELELEPWGSCWAWMVLGASCRGASAVTKPELAERPQKGEGSGCRSARLSLEMFTQEGEAPALEGT